jgi:hypothetical protein
MWTALKLYPSLWVYAIGGVIFFVLVYAVIAWALKKYFWAGQEKHKS